MERWWWREFQLKKRKASVYKQDVLHYGDYKYFVLVEIMWYSKQLKIVEYLTTWSTERHIVTAYYTFLKTFKFTTQVSVITHSKIALETLAMYWRIYKALKKRGGKKEKTLRSMFLCGLWNFIGMCLNLTGCIMGYGLALSAQPQTSTVWRLHLTPWVVLIALFSHRLALVQKSQG